MMRVPAWKVVLNYHYEAYDTQKVGHICFHNKNGLMTSHRLVRIVCEVKFEIVESIAGLTARNILEIGRPRSIIVLFAKIGEGTPGRG